MNKPAAFIYETVHKVIETTNPKIITIQGVKCLDGGFIKNGSKVQPYMIRLDNKPELVAKLEAYQQALDEYNAWFAQQVETVKATIKIDTPHNFTEAENDDFSWTTFDGTSGKCLTEKATGKEIYQMSYSYSNLPLSKETKLKVELFVAALDAIKSDIKAANIAAAKAWKASPEGQAEAAKWKEYEAFKREMEAPNSDY